MGMAFAAAVGFSPARACQICVPFPRKSAADFLIEAESVVLAREDAERPFHFTPIETLKGDLRDEKIDLFLDSPTRRLLSANPERSVVIARRNENGKATWKRVGTADATVESVVREILRSAADWKKAPLRRIDFFAQYLGHENPQISALAHLEIARAPYAEIRRLGNVVPRGEIHRFLGEARYVEWHPLYILLLAQTGDARDREFIETSFDSAMKFGTLTRLPAWATAAIELGEEDALEVIEDRFFRNPNREPEELNAVLQALSVHGTGGHVHLRDRIVASYGTLLTHHPETAPMVVGDLVAWKRGDLAETIGRIAAAPPRTFDFQTLLKLRRYLREVERGKGKDRQSARP